MSMGAMTTSAQVLQRAGWTVTVYGENANDGGGKPLLLMAIIPLIGIHAMITMVQVMPPKVFLSSL